jgi:hypothetical protein
MGNKSHPAARESLRILHPRARTQTKKGSHFNQKKVTDR